MTRQAIEIPRTDIVSSLNETTAINYHNGEIFTGSFKIKDHVSTSDNFRGVGEVTHCFGWNSDVSCYTYIVHFGIDTYGHLPEYKLQICN